MLRKILTLAISISIGLTGYSQDSSKTSSFTLSGSADVYYRYNFNNPKAGVFNNLTSFTNSHNSFELGMASLKAEHSIGKVSMVADLGFGRRADEFSYNDEKSRLAIKQLYFSYAPTEKFKITVGSWATHIGYELVDAYLNRNYSMSYMFSYGPFFHTGIKGEFVVGDKTSIMLGLANPTDLKTASGMPKMAIAQFATGTKDDKFKLYLNYQGGNFTDSARLNQADVVLTYALTDKFSLGYNGTVQSRQAKVFSKWSENKSWWGSALYANVDPTDKFGLTLRAEYFSDKKDVLGLNSKIFETTLSANFKIDNLTIIPELRLDNANKELFTKSNGASTKSTVTGVIAAVYNF